MLVTSSYFLLSFIPSLLHGKKLLRLNYDASFACQSHPLKIQHSFSLNNKYFSLDSINYKTICWGFRWRQFKLIDFCTTQVLYIKIFPTGNLDCEKFNIYLTLHINTLDSTITIFNTNLSIIYYTLTSLHIKWK